MRKTLYGILLTALFFIPLRRINVADLLPVETVAVYMEDEQVVLETDTGHSGAGKTVAEALAALKKNTTHVIYLDTAEYLLVSERALDAVGDLHQCLKGSVKVGICEAKGRVQEAAKYLDIHQKMPRLRQWKNKIENTENSA